MNLILTSYAYVCIHIKYTLKLILYISQHTCKLSIRPERVIILTSSLEIQPDAQFMAVS